MIDGWILTLTVTGAVGTGLVAGVFFAFSTFVMRALDRLPPAQGVAAMNSINVTVINPLFMLALMGTAGVCVVLGVAAIVKWNEPGAGLVLAGSVSYLVLTILVTMAYHVPRNDALARRDPAAADTARYWAHHVTTWTAGNHLRVVGALAAAVSVHDRAGHVSDVSPTCRTGVPAAVEDSVEHAGSPGYWLSTSGSMASACDSRSCAVERCAAAASFCCSAARLSRLARAARSSASAARVSASTWLILAMSRVSARLAAPRLHLGFLAPPGREHECGDHDDDRNDDDDRKRCTHA